MFGLFRQKPFWELRFYHRANLRYTMLADQPLRLVGIVLPHFEKGQLQPNWRLEIVHPRSNSRGEIAATDFVRSRNGLYPSDALMHWFEQVEPRRGVGANPKYAYDTAAQKTLPIFSKRSMVTQFEDRMRGVPDQLTFADVLGEDVFFKPQDATLESESVREKETDAKPLEVRKEHADGATPLDGSTPQSEARLRQMFLLGNELAEHSASLDIRNRLFSHRLAKNPDLALALLRKEPGCIVDAKPSKNFFGPFEFVAGDGPHRLYVHWDMLQEIEERVGKKLA